MIGARKQNVGFAPASAWIQDCLKNHPDCFRQPDRDWSFRPTRLIDVSSRACLRVTYDLGRENTRYVALSHRRGRDMSEAAKTSVSNQISRSQGISEDALPSSFRHAFAFARSLGVSYVWIDSLCVIQDPLEDVHKEIAQMSDIYSYSYCTLAVSYENATHQKYFSSETYRILRSRDVQMLVDPITSTSSQMRVLSPLIWGQMFCPQGSHLEQYSKLRCRLDWIDALNSIPLHERGWTLREREISPRVLHYRPMTALWECRSLRASEKEPIGFSDHGSLWHGVPGVLTPISRYRLLDNHSTQRDRLQFGLSLAVKFTGKHDETYNSWLRLIEDYSKRRLTFPNHKFAAISGLAQRVQPLVDSEYLAGLWRRDISRELLWRTIFPGLREPEECHPRPYISARHYPEKMCSTLYPAPSWSWASVNDAISYDLIHTHLVDDPDEDTHKLPKILDIYLETSDLYPKYSWFGNGAITLSGRLKPLRTLLKESQEMKLYFDTEVEEVSREGSVLLIRFTGKNEGFSKCALGMILEETSGITKVYRRSGVAGEILQSAFNDTWEIVITIT